MNENPFVRVYEDEEHRETSDMFWVNLNHVDSIEISKGGAKRENSLIESGFMRGTVCASFPFGHFSLWLAAN